MQTFDDIFGQDDAVARLRQAYAADRLPHGLVFTGPAGVGKATTAAALGALFLCEKPKAGNPCRGCESCRAFEAGAHPDYHVVYRQLVRLEKETAKARDLSVDVIREYLVGPADRKTVMNRGKVFVVEEADLMSASAQNALLKTLEEPYGRTLIVLLTDQPGMLLPTIHSRCQLVRFKPLDDDLVRHGLEERGVDRRAAADAARLSGGSLGVALKWAQDGVVAAAAELIEQLDRIASGRGADDLAGWLKRAAEAYADKQLERDKLASKDQATREGLTLYFRIAAEHVRRRMETLDDPDALEVACAQVESIALAEKYVDENVNVALALQQLSGALAEGVGASGGP